MLYNRIFVEKDILKIGIGTKNQWSRRKKVLDTTQCTKESVANRWRGQKILPF
jgi:hypothetical protein